MIVRDDRKLASIRIIQSIEPIEGADRIEVARIGGWNVVVQKGLYEPGDAVVYFEIDSCLPVDNELFAFLKERGTRKTDEGDVHVVKTVRLRGVYSQGLCIPVEEIFPGSYWDADRTPDGTDVTSLLGIGKWEPGTNDFSRGNTAGSFPLDLAMKTDSERVQNLTSKYEYLLDYDWEATVKVDGTSCTVGMRPDDEIVVASRNLSVTEGDNTYWRAARQIIPHLTPGMAVQMEIAGPGIQGNPQKLANQRVYIFDVVRNGFIIPRSAWPVWAQELSAPVLPDLKLPETVEEAIAQADGLKYDFGGGRVLAEGIVWHEVNGQAPAALGRSTFKVVSNKYLLKH